MLCSLFIWIGNWSMDMHAKWVVIHIGMQDRWGSEVLQEIEWETDHCFAEGHLPASSGKRVWYYAGLTFLPFLLCY